MRFRTRFALGLIMGIIGTGFGGLARVLQAIPEAGAPPSAPVVLYTIGGTLILLGLTLALFGKIALTPWFGIDLKGAKPAVSIGPPFMAFVVGGEPRKGWCIRFLFKGTYLSVSWLSRVLIRLSLAAFAGRWVYLSTLGSGSALRHSLTAGVGAFIAGILIERGLKAAFGPSPEDFEAAERGEAASPATEAGEDRPPAAEAIAEI